MISLLEKFNKDQLKKLPDLRPGDTIKVHQKIKEGNKERIQIFEGIIIAKKHGKDVSSTITVRKVVDGIGVERVFPIHSPAIEKIEIIRRGKVRRSKLYFLRTAKGRKAKLKRKDFAAAIAPESASLTDGEPKVSEEEPKEEPQETATENTAEE